MLESSLSRLMDGETVCPCSPEYPIVSVGGGAAHLRSACAVLKADTLLSQKVS